MMALDDSRALELQETMVFLPEPARIVLAGLRSDVARWRSRAAHLDIDTEITVNHSTLHCRARPARLRDMARGTCVEARIGDLPVTFGIMSNLAFWLKGQDAPVDDLHAVAPETLAIVIEHLLTPDLEVLERQFDTKIEITGVLPRRHFRLDQAFLRLALQKDGGDVAFAYMWSSAPEAVLSALEARFARKPARDLGSLGMQVCVLGPLSLLPSAQLAGLGPGDVLVPGDGWTRADLHAHLLIDNDHIIPLRAVDTGLVCDPPGQAFSALLHDFSKDPDMTSIDTEIDSTFADPRSLVTVELNRARMTVSQLQDLQNGDVLDFDIAAIEMVKICANGTPIAEGELVQLDDTIGVHITRLL